MNYVFVNGQIEYNGVKYNKLIPVYGTNYVIATFKDSGLKAVANNRLLFINTATNQKRKIDFPKIVYIKSIEQVKIDSLGINKIILATWTGYEKDKRIDLRERQTRILILSTDGQEITPITNDSLFVTGWAINSLNGIISIKGFYDTNKNQKKDKADKSEDLLFDLTTLKMIR